MISNRMDINNVLAEMRAIKAQASFPQAPATDQIPGRQVGLSDPLNQPLKETSGTSSFGDLMSQAINNVDDIRKESGALAKAYEMGTPGVDITDVMIASQKSSVSFQAMVQVRNKLVEAYKDVMNMPV